MGAGLLDDFADGFGAGAGGATVGAVVAGSNGVTVGAGVGVGVTVGDGDMVADRVGEGEAVCVTRSPPLGVVVEQPVARSRASGAATMARIDFVLIVIHSKILT